MIVSRKSIRNNHFRYMYSHSSFCNVRFTYTINRINKVIVSSSPFRIYILVLLELVFFKVISHTDTVHVAEDASESAFTKYPGADEMVTGSPQNSRYMYIMHATKS